MKELMSSNIYDAAGAVLIAGSCLESTHPQAFAQISAGADRVYTLCLEQTHINMAITKIAAMLGTGQIQRLVFASVDRSPHCVQLHYIKHELQRTMEIRIPVESYVAVGDSCVKVSEAAVEASKTLSRLTELIVE